MKQLAILTLALVSSASILLAQPTSFGSFKAEDQEIKFQKVFTQDTITIAKLEAFYKAQPFISKLRTSEAGLEFEMNDVIVDFKKFQFRQVDVPTLIQTGKYSGKVNVGVRDGRYRVTITSLQVIGDAGYRKITSLEPLTQFACLKSGTTLNPDWCKPNSLGLLELVFTDKLQFVAKKDDW
jgi:hypothetical protein